MAGANFLIKLELISCSKLVVVLYIEIIDSPISYMCYTVATMQWYIAIDLKRTSTCCGIEKANN